MSTPAPQDFKHYQGDTLEQPVRLRYQLDNGQAGAYADLTGWTPAAQARNARTRVLMPGLSAVLGNQVASPGLITLMADAATTATWDPGPSVAYDLQIVEDATGFVRTVLTGLIVVRGQVTT